jgi:hypothetical protein
MVDFLSMKVKADIRKNRLHLEISGKISKQELDKMYTDVRFCVADLQPGFSVINDLTACTLGHLTGIPTFKKIMGYLVKNGVGEVVRIINTDSLIFKQISNLSSQITSYLPIYVSSMQEAEEKLDKAVSRNGLRFHFFNPLLIQYVINESEEEGRILNISITGCKVGETTMVPSLDDEITLVIEFDKGETAANSFQITARVVRLDYDGFAVAFQAFDDAEKNRLWQCLLQKFENDLQQIPEGEYPTGR